MRIVGGKYRSRVLCEVKTGGVRPTSDMVRESLFNIWQNRIYGSDFLDLFCGTGAMGIEALSRGAGSVTFNDYSRESIKLLKQNLEKLKVQEQYQITNLDAITLLSRTDKKYDIIYIDPPYGSGLGQSALQRVARVMKEDAVAVFEDQKPFEGQIEGLSVVDNRKYGKVFLTFFKKGDMQ